MRQQKWKGSLEDRLTCKVVVAGALEWPRLRPLASARSPWHCLFFFFFLFLFMLCFSFSSPVGETKYMIGLLIQNWFCPWGSTSVLVKTTLFSHGCRKIEMNPCIKYHSYLKEGYAANMEDEDWNTDLPLCSSTKMNQLFHSDIPVKQHKSHFF